MKKELYLNSRDLIVVDPTRDRGWTRKGPTDQQLIALSKGNPQIAAFNAIRLSRFELFKTLVQEAKLDINATLPKCQWGFLEEAVIARHWQTALAILKEHRLNLDQVYSHRRPGEVCRAATAKRISYYHSALAVALVHGKRFEGAALELVKMGFSIDTPFSITESNVRWTCQNLAERAKRHAVLDYVALGSTGPGIDGDGPGPL